MFITTCPRCTRGTRRRLDAPSSVSDVDYYTCDDCGHVWTVTRDGSDKINHVTPLQVVDLG